MSVVIDSIPAVEEAHQKVVSLLAEEDSASAALAFAESLVAGPGQEANVKQLRAFTWTEVGAKTKDIALVERGIRGWMELGPDESATFAYNLANAQLLVWKLAVKSEGLADAWLSRRENLQQAREWFTRVAEDKGAEMELRLKALVDCGNSLDIVGRYIDAIDCYDRALKLDPTFGWALGNRGLALLYVAPLMGDHESHVLSDAAADLESALRDRERVLRCGGQSALDAFQRGRNSISGPEGAERNAHQPLPLLGDSHLDWCLRNRLFLHASPECIGEETELLDAVSFGRVTISLAGSGALDHANEIIDAFNSIKQDFLTGRYLAGLASANDSPIRKQAEKIAGHAWFTDTYNYASWGVRPGTGVQALKVALDTLDAIAVFAHLYFESDREVRDITFRTLPYGSRRNREELTLTLAEALEAPERNKGLMALIDISAELERKSRLSGFMERRHAVTHRFCSVHVMGAPVSSEWAQRVSWSELEEESLESLRIVRGAILCLAQMIYIHEKSLGNTNLPVLPFERSAPELADFERMRTEVRE